jgi:hypothetical protein
MKSATSVQELENAAEAEVTPSEPSDLYREAFLRATAHLGLTRERAAAMVEAIVGRPFDDCGWPELEPVVRSLRLVLERLGHVTNELED